MKQTRKKLRMPAKLVLLTACSSLLTITPPDALAQQNSMWYELFDYQGNGAGFDDIDVKGFSTEMISSTEGIMAGTLYDQNAGWGRPVFLHFDKQSPDAWPLIQSADLKVYNENVPTNYYDFRVVDVVPGQTNSYGSVFFITSSARMDAANASTTTKDKINVLVVDAQGNKKKSFNVEDMRTTGGAWGYSMYPTHSVFQTVGSTNTLYICGYTADVNSCSPANWVNYIPVITTPPPPPYLPGFHTPKKAFVLSVDVDANSIIACRYFDWAIVGGTTNTNEFDFDIAMRMTILSSNYGTSSSSPANTWNNNIHVTGSVTSKTGTNNGPTTPMGPLAYTMVRSGTMNILLDKNTLALQTDASFIGAGNGDGYGPSEYGIAFVENNKGLDNYIVSNVYDGTSDGYGGGYTPWAVASGSNILSQHLYEFNIQPSQFTVTHTTDLLLNTTTGTHVQRLHADKGWALQTMDDASLPNSILPSDKVLLVAGYNSNAYCDLSPDINARDSNIVPFVSKLEFNFTPPNGSLFGTIAEVGSTFGSDFYKIYPNQSGTGDPGRVANDEIDLGRNLSSLLWGPTFAARYSTSDDILMGVPKYGLDSSAYPYEKFLGLKTLYANSSDASCSTCVVNCEVPNFYYEDIEPASTGTAPYTGTNLSVITLTPNVDVQLTSINQSDAQLIYGTWGTCWNSNFYPISVYKTGIGEVKSNTGNTLVYPNPAGNTVQMSLAHNVDKDADIKAELTDITGRVIATLYKGRAIGITSGTFMNLPAIANGLYIVTVYADNKPIHTQKLSVQQ